MMELSRVTAPMRAWWRDRPAERADHAIQELEDACRLLSVPGPTEKVKDALRSSYSRTFTTSHRAWLGVVVTVVLLGVTTKAGWSWSGDTAAIARNPHPRPYQPVVFLLCYIPMVVLGRHTHFDPRPDRASRKFARAVVSCAEAQRSSPAEQDRYMRQLNRRLGAVDQLLQSVRSRWNTMNYLHKKVWPARARLLELQGRLDSDADQALRELAETLITVARQYVDRNFTNLLDLPSTETQATDGGSLRNYDWLRRLGTVAFACLWIWWASGLPLEGWSQAMTVAVGPFLAFTLFYGIQLGFRFLDRLPGIGGQQEPTPSDAVAGASETFGATVESSVRTPASTPAESHQPAQ
ncbi:hypothetical protein [Kitasatospora sp. NRRL B-11411]|uniref:hypothetical protein n=1 Tax=Kitasatospora sp. NRRL B-11411 TaxID=1463822 RepID=UPI0004C2C9C6|nr:hypothetical protein [Kitasatospora sp. NRRL B-11411]